MDAKLEKSYPASAQVETLWGQIVHFTREACVLRHDERESEAAALLQQELPPLIRTWSGRCGLSADACRQRLRDLFAAEQERVKTALLYRRLVVDEVCARLDIRVSASSSQARPATVLKTAPGSIQLRRRVPIDDVVGMLDALREAERTTVAEAMLPARRAMHAHFSAETPTITAGLVE